jgi:hypothetical protein
MSCDGGVSIKASSKNEQDFADVLRYKLPRAERITFILRRPVI